MKVRTGFVSNSSSSSFCLYGTGDNIALPGRFDGEWEAVEAELVKIDKRFACVSVCGEAGFLGIEWSLVNDDETGLQFKTTIENALKTVFDRDIKCSTHSEAWYDG